jgi:hypothetical protein
MVNSTEQFIAKAKEVHGTKFDYSKVNYVSRLDKVVIICSVHGEFEQVAKDHLSGRGCLKCARQKQKNWIDKKIYNSGRQHNEQRTDS